MPTRISEKMGIKEGDRVLAVDAPPEAIAAIDMPKVHLATSQTGTFDHIIFFVKTQAALDAMLPKLKHHMAPRSKLWVAWPKGGKLGANLNIKEVIRIGYTYNLVESVNLRIDDTWTALKFTHPKPGKIYNNSYGQLSG